MDVNQVQYLLRSRFLRGCRYIGSAETGKIVAGLAGQNMVKATFELGGNDPFIVFKDANIDKAVEAAYVSRMHCNAQATVNAKRFIVHDEVYDLFKNKLLEYIEEHTVIGDPFDLKTTFGPMGKKRTLDTMR